MKPLEALVRPCIYALAPYSTARDDYNGGMVDVWLDANESPYNNGTNRYPDPHQKELKAKLSEIKGVDPERIFIGNGSDEAIDLAFRIFCEPGVDNVVAIAPSYGMYGVAANINNVEVREVLLNPDFSLPVDRLMTAADPHTKVMFICSPNNPTGNAFPLTEIKRLCELFDGMVVVDEAYVDFSKEGSMLGCLSDTPNLIVLQTLSKARGMAALRLGMAFASPEVMRLFANVKYPYNISQLTQDTVMKALDSDISWQIEEVKSERSRLVAQLSGLGSIRKIYPSDANFLLIAVDDADMWYDRLMSAGIIVRNRSRMPLCENCLRVTVGTPEENNRVIDTFKSFDKQ